MNTRLNYRPSRLVLPGLAALVLISACSDEMPVKPPQGGASEGEVRTVQQAQIEATTPVPQTLEVNREDRLIARIQDRTAEELGELLLRAENTIAAWEIYPDYDPIEFILDGPEARLFVRSNYGLHRELVDRAARLDAFGVIDVKICERWMEANEVMSSDFPAFVDTVNYGPAAKRQLLREGYIYF